jgi:hypothetical protein
MDDENKSLYLTPIKIKLIVQNIDIELGKFTLLNLYNDTKYILTLPPNEINYELTKIINKTKVVVNLYDYIPNLKQIICQKIINQTIEYANETTICIMLKCNIESYFETMLYINLQLVAVA